MDLKLHKAGQESVFVADDLFFGITDIDASQSYKVLNSENELSPQNMYAKAAGDLQKKGSTLKNMFVESDYGNYIYSQHTSSSQILIGKVSNIYLKLDDDTLMVTHPARNQLQMKVLGLNTG